MPRTFIRQFGRDERGATMIEYTILLGVITAAVMGMVLAVGNWTNSQWTDLNAAVTNCEVNPNAGDPNASDNAENNAACDSAASNQN